MHASQREAAILKFMASSGFVTFRDLESQFGASPATLRRDLERLSKEGRIERIHGGARLIDGGPSPKIGLTGVP
ncbi:MAG: DeoR family transcriptional regulator, partial [Hyphomonadaceae bacterium]|nr:DeoR family transcriptional regulator [Hyphomonadaceae bacterium]